MGNFQNVTWFLLTYYSTTTTKKGATFIIVLCQYECYSRNFIKKTNISNHITNEYENSFVLKGKKRKKEKEYSLLIVSKASKIHGKYFYIYLKNGNTIKMVIVALFGIAART